MLLFLTIINISIMMVVFTVFIILINIGIVIDVHIPITIALKNTTIINTAICIMSVMVTYIQVMFLVFLHIRYRVCIVMCIFLIY